MGGTAAPRWLGGSSSFCGTAGSGKQAGRHPGWSLEMRLFQCGLGLKEKTCARQTERGCFKSKNCTNRSPRKLLTNAGAVNITWSGNTIGQYKTNYSETGEALLNGHTAVLEKMVKALEVPHRQIFSFCIKRFKAIR